MNLILTGASRGIGRALAERLDPDVRLHAIARGRAALESLAAARPGCRIHAVDLSSRDAASRLGEELARDVSTPTALVHNAGLWPSSREHVGGLERAFVVNCVAPLLLQAPLLATNKVTRVLVVGAGLMVKGRFDAHRTPTGADFSWFRTYASTKLAFAVATRELAKRYPQVDFAVVHPGIVNTELGARTGLLGGLLRLVKRRWESPEVCAQRLVSLLARPRWSSRDGEAAWYFESQQQPWPAIVADSTRAVRNALDEQGIRL